MGFLEGLGIGAKAVLATQGPIGAIAIGLINKYLPSDKAVDDSITVEGFDAKLDELSSEDKAQVVINYHKEVTARAISKDGVDINHVNNITEQLRIMEEADVRIRARPDIAILMSKLVVLSIGITVIGHVCISVYNHTPIDIQKIMILLTLPTWTITTYFNRRSDDKSSIVSAVSGVPSPPKSFMTTVVEKFKK